ncbi:MAG: aldehyde ferredoxin oxidoreductase family protein [Defluviitaleaceae bacterium]|nr:aldehyde ferredoxin oxidoreductase family protein [Defluviitaleaceae bacterium]
MATSYNGKILRVNLTERSCKVEDLDLNLAKKFVGGRGLGSKILFDEVDPKVDPLSPENKVIIATGPLTGVAVPTGCRYMVITKSPLNNMIACSNSGGVWGAKLKYAGFDLMILEGKADKPCYINIVDDKYEILDASDLWGQETEHVEEVLKGRHEGCSVLNIGPGGEQLSLLAAVMNDAERAAGRSGVGAVLGSKNVKAICCASSRTSVEPADAAALKEVVSKANKLIKENGVAGQGLPKFGTAVLVNILNSVGAYPTRNWQESEFDGAEATSGETMADTVLVKNGYCHRCPIGCARVVKLDGKDRAGAEYETLWSYGASCGVSDLDAINRANWVCNETGIDTISAGCTIAAAMELYQRGYIKDEDCEGVPLVWGSGDAIVKWTERMGKGETKLGKLMAQGSYRLCEHYGVPEFSMSSKKLDLPAYDARAIQGIGVTYATSNRGGCHVRGYTIAPEIAGIPEKLEMTSIENKHTWSIIFQNLTAVIDSSGMCLFTSFALSADVYAEMLNAATGTSYDVNGVLEAGERIYNLERLFNQKAGMKPEDDSLPKRLLEEPITGGPAKGSLSRLPEMLPEYYKARGWENAFPTAVTLERLGL